MDQSHIYRVGKGRKREGEGRIRSTIIEEKTRSDKTIPPVSASYSVKQVRWLNLPIARDSRTIVYRGTGGRCGVRLLLLFPALSSATAGPVSEEREYVHINPVLLA